MLDQLARLNADHLSFLAVMTGLLVASLTIICSVLIVQARRFRERQLELGFREEMLRRGLSVEQVVQLLTTRRPPRSQSVTARLDRAWGKLASAGRRLADWTPRAVHRCRQWLRPVWNDGVSLCRRTWRQASHFGREAWQAARPLVEGARTAISRCAARLSDGLDSLTRRLMPHQP